MIYVLFGPPGVGKSYTSKVIGKAMGWPVLEADDLITPKEAQLIKTGGYDDKHREPFVGRLKAEMRKLHERHEHLIVAEAFTKDENRRDCLKELNGDITFVRITTPRDVAESRASIRMGKERGHVITPDSFVRFWDEFEEPTIPHGEISNSSADEADLVKQFTQITEKIGV